MHIIRKFSVLLLIYSLLYANASARASVQLSGDTITVNKGGVVKKSIYPIDERKRSGIYNSLWGKHYRALYSTPIAVRSTRLYDLYGGIKVIGQEPHIHALFLEDKDSRLYMVRPLGGATTFMESDFFKNTYNKQEYEGTYIDKFIEDAYTVTHPYAFMVANKLAEGVGVNSLNSKIYYIPKHVTTDTIADGSGIEDRLISIYDLKSFSTDSKVIETPELLQKLQNSKNYRVDQNQYIRERILDILIGDWNKTSESWQWIEVTQGDSLLYKPVVVDRSHAFTKVDGAMFKIMLSAFGLGTITNYDSNLKNLEKANSIAIPLDIALVAQTGREEWNKEAKYVKQQLTDEIIDEAFRQLPEEIYKSPDTEVIKANLKKRRDKVESIADRYYNILQKTPVITGTNNDDLFVIDSQDGGDTRIRIYDRSTNDLFFDKQYDKSTGEIWVYGLDGDDVFKFTGGSGKNRPLVFVGGKGENVYNVEGGNNLDIYDYKSHSIENDTLGNAKMIRTNIENVHKYDQEKVKYETFSFSPWGVYDSDLGLYLGAYLTKTVYGFKRSPYSYRHRIGYSYLDGLMYQGLFPSLDEMKGYNIEAIFGIANTFQNFFGYGNTTYGFKDESIRYNRVSMGKYSIEPSYYWKFDKTHKLTAATTLRLYHMDKPKGRYINEVYGDDNAVFETKIFADFNLTYEINRQFDSRLKSIDFLLTPGWNWNIKDPKRNYPYLKSKFSFEITINERLSLATQVVGTVLFSSDYEFYQAATVELRGYRSNRFIGKQSLYQHTDIRYDLGQLKNPFTPVQYGVFAGVDYGRVWYPGEDSSRWHTSYGGGWWLTLFKDYTGKFSYFASKDGARFYIGLGMGF